MVNPPPNANLKFTLSAAQNIDTPRCSLHLQLFIGKVYRQLFEGVCWERLEAEDVKNTEEMAVGCAPRVRGQRGYICSISS